jgi:hypothetical protein
VGENSRLSAKPSKEVVRPLFALRMTGRLAMFAALLVLITVTLHGCRSGEEGRENPPTAECPEYHIGIPEQCDYDDNTSISWSCNETHFTTVRKFNSTISAACGQEKTYFRTLELFSLAASNTTCDFQRALREDFCNMTRAEVFDNGNRAEIFSQVVRTRNDPWLACGLNAVAAANTCLYRWHPLIQWSVVREFSCQPSEGTYILSHVEVRWEDALGQPSCDSPRPLPSGRSCADQLEIYLSHCANVTASLEGGLDASEDPFEMFLYSTQWLGPARRLRSASQGQRS